jgi:hypothetical protein
VENVAVTYPLLFTSGTSVARFGDATHACSIYEDSELNVGVTRRSIETCFNGIQTIV